MFLNERPGLRPDNWKLLAVVCIGQVILIVLPFLTSEMAPPVVALVLFSLVALFGSVTFATLYLCVISAVVPSQIFDDSLTLPLDFKFYEGLFALVCGMAALSWLQEPGFFWRRRTRLDRPVLVFLGVVLFSMLLGQYYGQSTSQMLRDVRYPLYYAFFFVVTGFFDLRRGRTFLTLLVLSSAVVGVEYLVEFLGVVNTSISGSFFRVARIEGLMMPMGVLTALAALLYDSAFHRRLMNLLVLVPIGLALMLTVGRGMWIAVISGVGCLGGLVFLDGRSGSRGRRVVLLVLLPILLVGMGYLFQRITKIGLGETAFKRMARIGDYQRDHSIVGRLMSYGVALQEIRKRPILGGGHGATVTYLVTDQIEPFVLTVGGVDNVYLTVLLRMGVVGLAAFLWMFGRGLKVGVDLYRRTDDIRVKRFCATFFAVYVAMLVYGVADNTMMGNRLIFWHATFLGILARLDEEARHGQIGYGSGGELERGQKPDSLH
ncbi:MAG: O-antigen ligase family protein [bacterium]|nr:O-antigen ligase family protein [bacterium]